MRSNSAKPKWFVMSLVLVFDRILPRYTNLAIYRSIDSCKTHVSFDAPREKGALLNKSMRFSQVTAGAS